MEEKPTKGRKPAHRIYAVTGEGKDAQWTPIGAAWPTKNGGYVLSFVAYPATSGRVVMQPIDDSKGEGEGQ